MAHVSRRNGLCPRVVVSVDGEQIVPHDGPSGRYFVRVLGWIPGTPLGAVPHHSAALLEDLGRRVGEIDRALATFDHPAVHRELHWDLAHGVGVVRDHLPAVAGDALRQQLEAWTGDIARHLEPRLRDLRRSAVHNDANDHNVIVAADGDVWSRHQRIAAIIDFGDIVHSFVAADPAIAIAYAVLDKPDPLAAAVHVVRGYHAAWPLREPEISALFDLVRLRLCVSVALAADQQAQRPDDEYLGISQGPIARTLPALMSVPRRLAEAAFRDACGLDSLPASTRVTNWLETRAVCAPIVAMDPAATLVLDLSVGSPLIAGDPAGNGEPGLTPRIARAMTDAHADVAIGRYGEPRSLYSSSLFEAGPDGERRTIHLGVDLFAPPGTAVHAPLPGVVHAVSDNATPLDYGPVVILKHETDELDPFYTLYGHLTRQSLGANPVGRRVDAGEAFAAIGAADVNGGWTPHLHFQLIVALLDLGVNFPGVCRASQRTIWQALSPDPNSFLRVPGASFPDQVLDKAAALTERRRRIGANVTVGYRDPVRAVRGWMQFLYDDSGRRYLDAYNNVPHVGHCHPRVVGAASEQLAVLNTNTRYLHDGLARLAGRLAATLPDPLSVCYFVNSGSEANELALRLARAHTGRRDLLVLDGAYHGNTTTLIDISPYKFAGPGGNGAPAWVQTLPLPDVFRGEFKGEDAGPQVRRLRGGSHRSPAIPFRTARVRFHRGKLPERRWSDRPAGRLPRDRLCAGACRGRCLHRRRSADRLRPRGHAFLCLRSTGGRARHRRARASRSATGIRSERSSRRRRSRRRSTTAWSSSARLAAARYRVPWGWRCSTWCRRRGFKSTRGAWAHSSPTACDRYRPATASSATCAARACSWASSSSPTAARSSPRPPRPLSSPTACGRRGF